MKHLLIITTLLLATACSIAEEEERGFDIDRGNVMQLTRLMLSQADTVLYADKWIPQTISADTCTLWIGKSDINADADSLLSYLWSMANEGISPEFFRADYLQQQIDSVHAWAASDRHELLTDTIAAEIESALTHAYLRYAYGQRYGFTQPRALHNHLLKDADSPNKTNPPYRKLYDIPCEVPTDSLAHVAIGCLREGKAAEFLRSVQPENKLHRLFVGEYKKALAAADTVRATKAAANIERSRWRYERPDTGRYVLVNLAAQKLWAVDEHRDTCIDMRICCGNLSHKSPMLKSRISYIELDPYWNVPMSIIRNEVVKYHLNDSAYFARNRMEAIDNNTKETVDPVSLTSDQWCSGRYSLRQDKGKGNSLGRMVFRFPNIFSVYLHDTNSPGAFSNDRRTVSHGCIRVQKPMALAQFLLETEVTPLYLDRIRLSIDLPPVTAQGRKLKEQDPTPLKRCDFKRPVPLWIDYYTMYPDRQGNIVDYPDIYSYDKAIIDALKAFIDKR